MSKFRFPKLVMVIILLTTPFLTNSCTHTNKKPFGAHFESPPQRFMILGNVVDAKTGEPLIGCPVIVEGTTFGALTDVYGTYAIYDVPNGNWSISAKMVGFKTQTDSVTVGKVPAIANFQLEESEITLEYIQSRPRAIQWESSASSSETTGTITGKLVDSETKEPLIGYPVQIEGSTLGALSDVDGIYTIKEVPYGTHNLSSKAVGYQSQIKKVVVDEKPAVVDFELKESEIEIACFLIVHDNRKFGTITGKVISLRTDEPIPGIIVQVDNTELSAITDTTGFYSIKSVPHGFQKISLRTARGKEFTQDVIVSSKPAIVNFKYLSIGS